MKPVNHYLTNPNLVDEISLHKPNPDNLSNSIQDIIHHSTNVISISQHLYDRMDYHDPGYIYAIIEPNEDGNHVFYHNELRIVLDDNNHYIPQDTCSKIYGNLIDDVHACLIRYVNKECGLTDTFITLLMMDQFSTKEDIQVIISHIKVLDIFDVIDAVCDNPMMDKYHRLGKLLRNFMAIFRCYDFFKDDKYNSDITNAFDEPINMIASTLCRIG